MPGPRHGRPDPDEPHLAVTAFVAAAPAVDGETRAAILPAATAAAISIAGVLVATCHRLEVYGAPDVAPPVRSELVRAGMTELRDDAAARAAIGLALGLRSAVLGEDEVLHQLRGAVAEARARGPLTHAVGLLMDHALRAGRLARSWRPVARRGAPRSLGDTAIARVEAATGGLRDRHVLVIGAGAMGRAAAVAAHGRGASVVVASRTFARAQALALELGVEASPLDSVRVFGGVDAVIVALAGPWEPDAETRLTVAGRATVVDLSMPGAVPSDLRAALGDRFVGIDDLAAPSTPDGPDARYRERLERLRERTLSDYLAALVTREASAADRLAAHVERHRRAELEAWLRRRPDLDPTARAHLEDLSRELSARLFREPLARLGRDPEGRRRQALEELFDA